MKWETIKSEIETNLSGRNLKNPKIRLNALQNIEKLIKQYNPEILNNPLHEFSLIEKQTLKAKLSEYKRNLKLNSAESSIINQINNLA